MEYNKGVERFFIIIFFLIMSGIFIYIIVSAINSNRYLSQNDIEESNNFTDNTSDNLNTKKDNVIDNNENTRHQTTTIIQQKEPNIEYVETKISSYSTTIYDNDKNRMFNIKLACSKLDGYVIKSGNEFSFNKVLGPMDKQAGYKKAIGFDSNGKNIKVYAGGMCQLSSTTYNTALIAELEITERHAHSKRVSYVPKGKDATIFYDSIDLKFINNNDFDIKITAYSNGKEVTVEMYKISSD